MSASNVKAGRAWVELAVEDAGFRKGLARNSQFLKSFGATLTKIGAGMIGMGAAIGGALGAASKMFANAGSDLHDMSARTGVAVEALSALGYAAEQAGADIGTVEFGIRRAQNAIAEAAAGSKTAAASLRSLGLSARDLKDLTPDQQFTTLAEKIAALKTPAERTSIALDLFGRSGTMLLPMMQDLNKSMDEAKRFGLVVSSQDAKLADSFGDALATVWKQGKMVVFHVGAAVAEAVMPYTDAIKETFGQTLKWLSANRGLVVTVGAVAGALLAAGATLVGLGLGIKVLGVALGGLLAIGTAIKAVFLAIVSPLGVVTALAAGLGVYLAQSSTAGAKALAWLGGKFEDLKDSAVGAL